MIVSVTSFGYRWAWKMKKSVWAHAHGPYPNNYVSSSFFVVFALAIFHIMSASEKLMWTFFQQVTCILELGLSHALTQSYAQQSLNWSRLSWHSNEIFKLFWGCKSISDHHVKDLWPTQGKVRVYDNYWRHGGMEYTCIIISHTLDVETAQIRSNYNFDGRTQSLLPCSKQCCCWRKYCIN